MSKTDQQVTRFKKKKHQNVTVVNPAAAQMLESGTKRRVNSQRKFCERDSRWLLTRLDQMLRHVLLQLAAVCQQLKGQSPTLVRNAARLFVPLLLRSMSHTHLAKLRLLKSADAPHEARRPPRLRSPHSQSAHPPPDLITPQAN